MLGIHNLFLGQILSVKIKGKYYRGTRPVVHVAKEAILSTQDTVALS